MATRPAMARAPPSPFVKVENVYAPSTTASPHTNSPLENNLLLLVLRLEKELVDVKTRLATVEAEVVHVREALRVERQLRATATTKSEPKQEEMEQPIVLPLLADDSDDSDDAASEASSSDTPSEFKWEPSDMRMVPRPLLTTIARKKGGSAGTANKARKPVRSAGGRLCSAGNCPSYAQIRGLCYRHSGVPRPQCSEPGCEFIVYSKGKCHRHGGKAPCSEPGCSKVSSRYGLCYRHGGFVQCAATGCSNKANRADKCRRHDRAK